VDFAIDGVDFEDFFDFSADVRRFVEFTFSTMVDDVGFWRSVCWIVVDGLNHTCAGASLLPRSEKSLS